MVVIELHRRAESGPRGVLGNIFALPLGRYQIPVGSKILGTRQRGVEVKAGSRWVGDIDKDMSALRVGVTVPPFEPLTLVEHFGKNQRRLDRIERFTFIKDFIVGI